MQEHLAPANLRRHCRFLRSLDLSDDGAAGGVPPSPGERAGHMGPSCDVGHHQEKRWMVTFAGMMG